MENTENTQAPASGFSLSTFSEDLWIRYSRQIVIVAVALVLAVVAWFGWKAVSARALDADNKKLGSIYVLLREENLPAAEAALNSFLAGKPAGLAADKANLYLGKTYFLQQRYDEAIAAYGEVGDRGTKVGLLHAGALHGMAASHMQKAEYAQAVDLLKELVDTYGARTGAPEENLVGQEVGDFAPNIANALWKLALCQRELGLREDAKATAERLVRVYPASREAKDAEKLLTVL
jgi:TolA-binding protein